MDARLNDHALIEVIAAAYDSALDPARWPVVLELLGRAFNSGFTDVFARTNDRSRWHGLAYGMEEAEYQDVFLGEWSKRNVWSARRPVIVAGEILSTRQMISREELMGTDMYDEFLGPHGLHEGMRMSLWAGEGWVQDVSLLRPWSAGPFEAMEMARAEVLLPHLQRAAAVTRLLRETKPLVQAGLAALDSARQAAFVLDSHGSPLRFNQRAEALVAEADGLTMRSTGLYADGVDLWDALRGSMAAVAGVGRGGEVGRLRIPRPSGRRPLLLTVAPISADNDWSALMSPAVLVLVGEPDRPNPVVRAELAARFGLTTAEAELAALLADGMSLVEIASRRGRSMATLRTHLARLMSKTGVRRQAALVHTLLQAGAEPIETARPLFGAPPDPVR